MQRIEHRSDDVKQLLMAIAAVSTLTASIANAADDWPNRPVRVISTFAAGGTADVLARLVAEHMSTAFNQQFFVEVRAGAGGTIGVKSVVDSPPDGYNFALTNVTQLVLLPLSNPKLGYDPKRDLTNIAFVAGSPVLISVNANSGIKSLKDLVARGKEKTQTYSSSGLGSMGHLVGESFAHSAKIKVEHVPYKGASQGLTDLAGGHIVFASQTVSSTAALMRSGAIAGLAVSTPDRLPDYPNIPTFKEEGFPELVSTIWFGFSGPANLPASITNKVNQEIARAMAKPEIQARLKKDGLISQAMSPEAFRKLIDEESVRWRPVIERGGLTN
jgi:tripartite-type tricarboxylate transporter receptor subunit TctC